MIFWTAGTSSHDYQTEHLKAPSPVSRVGMKTQMGTGEHVFRKTFGFVYSVFCLNWSYSCFQPLHSWTFKGGLSDNQRFVMVMPHFCSIFKEQSFRNFSWWFFCKAYFTKWNETGASRLEVVFSNGSQFPPLTSSYLSMLATSFGYVFAMQLTWRWICLRRAVTVDACGWLATGEIQLGVLW